MLSTKKAPVFRGFFLSDSFAEQIVFVGFVDFDGDDIALLQVFALDVDKTVDFRRIALAAANKAALVAEAIDDNRQLTANFGRQALG